MEIVLDVYDAFTRRDNGAPFAVYAPDIEVDFREGGGPDAQAVYHGHEGVRTAFRNWLAPRNEDVFRIASVPESTWLLRYTGWPLSVPRMRWSSIAFVLRR